MSIWPGKTSGDQGNCAHHSILCAVMAWWELIVCCRWVVPRFCEWIFMKYIFLVWDLWDYLYNVKLLLLPVCLSCDTYWPIYWLLVNAMTLLLACLDKMNAYIWHLNTLMFTFIFCCKCINCISLWHMCTSQSLEIHLLLSMHLEFLLIQSLNSIAWWLHEVCICNPAVQ